MAKKTPTTCRRKSQKSSAALLRIARCQRIAVSCKGRLAVGTSRPYLRNLHDDERLLLQSPKYPSHFVFDHTGQLLLVISTQGKVAAFDAADGSLLWKAKMSAETSGGAFSNDGSQFYVADWNGELVCFDVENGKEVWRRKDERMFGGIEVLANDRLSTLHRGPSSFPDPCTWRIYSPNGDLEHERLLPAGTRHIIANDDSSLFVQLHQDVALLNASASNELQEVSRVHIPQLYLGTIKSLDDRRIWATTETDWYIVDRQTGKTLQSLPLRDATLTTVSRDGSFLCYADKRSGGQLWQTERLIQTFGE